MKASVFVATSFDGFIARSDGSIDWLNESNRLVPEGEDCGFGDFMETVDALIMGRKTFEQVLTFGDWVYGETPVIVMSHNAVEIPEHLKATVSYSSERPSDFLNRLESLGMNHVYIDGGMTIQSFLREGIIDEVCITRIPIVIGEGVPLFKQTERDIHLIHQATNVFDFGFVQTTYKIEKK